MRYYARAHLMNQHIIQKQQQTQESKRIKENMRINCSSQFQKENNKMEYVLSTDFTQQEDFD